MRQRLVEAYPVSRNAEHDDVLEWTLAEAPPPDETPAEWTAPLEAGSPSAAAHEAHHARRFSRWTWLTLGGLILLSISAIAGYNAWNQWRAESALRQVVLEEETAALTGDVNALQHVIAPGYADWMEAQLALAERGQAAPVPLPWLRPPTQRGVIAAIKQFGSDIMLVTVRREFITPAGTPVAFTLPQFYQYQAGWKRVPPPPGYDGEQKELGGVRLTVVYAASDADLVTSIFPALDNMLQRACAEWACADDFAVTMFFLGDAPLPDVLTGAGERVVSAGGRYVSDVPLSEVVTDTLTGPRLFAVLAPFNTSWLDQDQLHLPAPHRAGAPADAAGVAEYQQMAAQTLLAYTAQQLYRSTDNVYRSERNAFVFALAARLSVRLGLEAPEALNVSAAEMMPNTFESLQYSIPTPWWNETAQRQTYLRGALVLLNAALEGEPVSVEHKLFETLLSNDNLLNWLTREGQLSFPNLFARFRRASETNYSILLPQQAQARFALSCQTLPALWLNGEAEPVSFLRGAFPFAAIGGLGMGGPVQPWSPDGQRLVLFANALAALDMQTHTLTWVPDIPGAISIAPMGWLSDTTLAYASYRFDASSSSEMALDLRFFDFAHPEQAFPVFADVMGYTLSPRKDLAVALSPGSQTESGPNLRMVIVPALGGEPLIEITGTRAFWSSDGGALAYVEQGSSMTDVGFVIRRIDFAPPPLRYTVQEGDTLWGLSMRFGVTLTELVNLNHLTSDVIRVGQTLIIPTNVEPYTAPLVSEVLTSADLELPEVISQVEIAWSPTEDVLAVAIMPSDNWRRQVLLLNANGTNRRLIYDGPGQTQISHLAFSADGQYVAFQLNGSVNTLVVHWVPSGERVIGQEGVNNFAWAPAGHTLAFLHGGELTVASVNTRGLNTQATLGANECEGEIWWNPAMSVER